MENPADYYQYIKFCPECGGELGINPIRNTRACYLHGDFVVYEGRVHWIYTKHMVDRSNTQRSIF